MSGMSDARIPRSRVADEDERTRRTRMRSTAPRNVAIVPRGTIATFSIADTRRMQKTQLFHVNWFAHAPIKMFHVEHFGATLRRALRARRVTHLLRKPHDSPLARAAAASTCKAPN